MKKVSPIIRILFSTEKVNPVPGIISIIKIINIQASLIPQHADIQDLF